MIADAAAADRAMTCLIRRLKLRSTRIFEDDMQSSSHKLPLVVSSCYTTAGLELTEMYNPKCEGTDASRDLRQMRSYDITAADARENIRGSTPRQCPYQRRDLASSTVYWPAAGRGKSLKCFI